MGNILSQRPSLSLHVSRMGSTVTTAAEKTFLECAIVELWNQKVFFFLFQMQRDGEKADARKYVLQNTNHENVD